MFKKNTRFLIKTPTGFEKFKGVQKKVVSKLYTFTFDDNTTIKCSSGHAFLTNRGFVQAQDVDKDGDSISGKRISSIEIESGRFEVYDPVGVSKHSTYYAGGVVSHNTEFVGSSNTLISPAKLRAMAFGTPLMSENSMNTYELPKEGHTYAIMVDVARGQGQDYSAFSIIDVTNIPYLQVATYRDNNIAPLVYPTIIHQAARLYKDAFILVEISDIGQQIADILHFELEYDNLVKVAAKGKMGQQITAGHTKRTQFGIKTSTATKRIGCSNLKTLVEQDKLLIQDTDTIMELTTFTAQKESFRAEEGNHDDLAMTLVLFGWFVAQRNFKDSMKDDIRRVLQKEQMDILDEDILPFGFMDDGINEHDDDGVNRWFEGRMKAYPLDSPYYDWNDKLAQDVRSRPKDGKS